MSMIAEVRTTTGRGFTPEELATQAAARIVSVADTAHPAIRDQAVAYRGVIETLLVGYFKQAVRSDRTTVYNTLQGAGHPELAKLIRRL